MSASRHSRASAGDYPELPCASGAVAVALEVRGHKADRGGAEHPPPDIIERARHDPRRRDRGYGTGRRGVPLPRRPPRRLLLGWSGLHGSLRSLLFKPLEPLHGGPGGLDLAPVLAARHGAFTPAAHASD